MSNLGRLRERTPLVQCITNTVVQNFTANALLALGAAPAMTDIVGEAGMFAGIADALLINLGTPTTEQREAALEAARVATIPWVLDPVAVGALPVRTALAHELVALKPTAIRGNASEIAALAGVGAGGRGVESTDSVDAVAEAAVSLASESGAIVAVSGPEDFITDGLRILRVANGHELLTKVTGGGCTLGAVVAAFLTVGSDPLEAVAEAHAFYGAAAQIAAEGASGPGSFAVSLIDALASDLPSSTLSIREA